MPCNMHENGHLATLSVIKQTHVIFFQLSVMLPIRISYWKWVVAVSWLLHLSTLSVANHFLFAAFCLSFYLTTFSFKKQLQPRVSALRFFAFTLVFCCAIWSLVDHLLSWLLERTSSFVVQLLLLGHCCCAVGLTHLLLLCCLASISTRTRVHSWSIVCCVHYRTSSGNWLFLWYNPLVSRCCSNRLLHTILKENTKIWLSAIWFEINNWETSQKLAASLLQ
jgi:hypothetical protein